MSEASSNPQSRPSHSTQRRDRSRRSGAAQGAVDEAIHRRLWSSPELAAHLCTTVRHVRRLVDEKRIPYIKVGHFVRFDPNEIDAWVDNQRVGQADPGRY